MGDFVVVHYRASNPGEPTPVGFPRVCGERDNKKQALQLSEDVRAAANEGDVVRILKELETFDVEKTTRLKARQPAPTPPPSVPPVAATPPASTAPAGLPLSDADSDADGDE